MTKRVGDNCYNNKKKFKTNGADLDDLWGDDFDAKEVEDCLVIASQICEQDARSTRRNNDSILPSYTSFAAKQGTSSTQLEFNASFTSTSKQNGVTYQNGFKRTRSFDTPESSQQLEVKIKKLQEQCLAKEGEVSILRSQVKELRDTSAKEYCKKEMEWSSKLANVTKQLNSVQSELQFKNLEVVSLKQQITSGKSNGLNQSFNCSQSPYFKHPKVVERPTSAEKAESSKLVEVKAKVNESLKLQDVVSRDCFLRDVFPTLLFERAFEDLSLGFKRKTASERLLSPQKRICKEKLVRFESANIVRGEQEISFECMQRALSKLMDCSLQEIDSLANVCYVNELICISEQLLFNLYQFLKELERNSGNNCDNDYKDNNLVDTNASLFDLDPWNPHEIAVSTRQSLACISELLPHSKYLRDYILQNKPLKWHENDELKQLSVYKENNLKYLQLISAILTLLKKLQKSYICPGFLSAVSVLGSKISLSNDTLSTNAILDLNRQIITCKPPIQAVTHHIDFLKHASTNKLFVRELCKAKSNKEEEKCLLQTFCVHIENGLLNMKTLTVAYLSFVQFVLNVAKCQPKWFYYQEENHCDCLSKLVNVVVDMIYQVLRTFHPSLDRQDLLLCSKILIKGIAVLYILNYEVYDSIIKYVATYSQYKFITSILLDMQDELNLEECEIDALEQLNVPSVTLSADEADIDKILIGEVFNW